MTLRKCKFLLPAIVALVALLCAAVLAVPTYTSAKAEAAAVGYVSSEIGKANKGTQWRFRVTFDGDLVEGSEDIEDMVSHVRLGGKPLSDYADSKVAMGTSNKIAEIFVGIDEFDENDSEVFLMLAPGFGGSKGATTENIGVVCNFAKTVPTCARTYRSDNYDDYSTVAVTSVSGPNIDAANLVLTIYFSDLISDRDMHDLQSLTYSWMVGSFGDNSAGKAFSNAELQLYHRFGLINEDNPTSLLYKIEYGCESYQGLEAYPDNKNSNTVDMTPNGTVDGLEMYSLYQIMQQVPDGGAHNLCVQCNVVGGGSQLAIRLKGDGNPGGVLNNIAPDESEKMVIRLRKGLMFPNGYMLKEDFTFSYNPVTTLWRKVGVEEETMTDTTLDNQEGYTAEELGLESGGKSGGGCGGNLAATALPAGAAMLIACGAVLAGCKKRKTERGDE